MLSLITEAKRIMDTYKNLPKESIIKESLVNELAILIVDHVCLIGDDISDFDFEGFFKKVEIYEEE
jgi:hypothetical protein